jgi:hypothetical protein
VFLYFCIVHSLFKVCNIYVSYMRQSIIIMNERERRSHLNIEEVALTRQVLQPTIVTCVYGTHFYIICETTYIKKKKYEEIYIFKFYTQSLISYLFKLCYISLHRFISLYPIKSIAIIIKRIYLHALMIKKKYTYDINLYI